MLFAKGTAKGSPSAVPEHLSDEEPAPGAHTCDARSAREGEQRASSHCFAADTQASRKRPVASAASCQRSKPCCSMRRLPSPLSSRTNVRPPLPPCRQSRRSPWWDPTSRGRRCSAAASLSSQVRQLCPEQVMQRPLLCFLCPKRSLFSKHRSGHRSQLAATSVSTSQRPDGRCSDGRHTAHDGVITLHMAVPSKQAPPVRRRPWRTRQLRFQPPDS